MKIIVCENERPALNQLCKLIHQVREDAEIVATAETGEEMLQILSSVEPELIFLDVELADGSCFDTFKDLDIRFPIILTTAFYEYALKAFKLNSIDYLLKPINEKEMERAFKKYESMRSTFLNNSNDYLYESKKAIEINSKQSIEELIGKVLREKSERENHLKRILVKYNDSIRLVQTSDIQWVESDGNYIQIYTNNKKYLLRSTLSGFYKQLDKKKFFQIHKSIILNIDFVSYMEEAIAHGDYKVFLENGTCLRMSRNFKRLLESM